MKQIGYLLIFLYSITSFGQYSQEYQKYKKQYPEDSFVRLQQETTFNLKVVKGKIKITRETFEEDLFLSESANMNSKNSLSYTTFFELKEINAASLVYTNNKYKEVKVTEFNEKNNLDDSFYDDSKTINYLYPDLKKGGKTSLRYTYNIKNSRFLSPFYFGDYFPIISNKVTIIADKNINLRFKELNTEGVNIIFNKKKKGRNFVYTWTLKDRDKYEYESGAPNYKTVLPHIVPIISSYKVNKTEVKVLESIDDLYNWYYSLVKNINQDPNDQELVAIVKELIKGKKTNKEKVEAIYYWTQKNIKYIAFEYALGGFIPREANDVYKKKYGDCKDNSSILFKMLEIAGLKGNLTWIGTRSIPYKYEEVPTPIVDNHMILSYIDGENIYYLDATGRYIPIDYPSSFIQGKEALISKGEGDYQIAKVPVIPAKMNAITDSTHIILDNQKVIGSATSKIKGYLRNDMFYNLENITSKAKIKAYYNRKFSKGNNKFLIKSFTEQNKFSYTKDFVLQYDFTIEDYYKKLGNEIYFNPHLNKVLAFFNIKKDRKQKLEYDYKKQYSFTTTIQIPDGYRVDYLPESLHIQDELATVELNYKKEGDKITCIENVSFDFLILSKEDQIKMNKIARKVKKAYKEIIIFKKI